MTCKLTGKTRALRVVALFIVVLPALIVLEALPQQTDVSQPSGQSSAGQQLPGAGMAQRVSVGTLEGNKIASAPLDGTNPLFLPPVTYDSGGIEATSVAVVDVNGDGKPDLVVANFWDTAFGNGSVGVLLGRGDGTFRPVVVYDSGGQWTVGLAVADMNGDGKPDLVTVNNSSDTIGVLLGNGDGSFQQAAVYDSGGAFPRSVAIADVNGDGKPDLLVANCGTNTCEEGQVGVLLGNGDGSFQPVVSYDSGGLWAWSVAVADVNGDGKPDVLVANSASDVIAVLLGNGDGTFKRGVAYGSGGSGPQSVVIADVNGDRKPDLLVGNQCDTSINCAHSSVGVLLGKGDGTFQPAVAYGPGGASLAVADVNGDGKPDLVVANAAPGAVGVLLGNGDGTFQAALTSPGGGVSVVADVNGDRRPDLLVAEGNSVGVQLNNTGPHTPTTTALASNVNPASTFQTITYTATVTSQNGKALTGTVSFQDGGNTVATVTLTGNQASYSTSYRKTGAHVIVAAYSGNLHNSVSTSATVTEYIMTLPITSKTVVTTSKSPSFIGQPVTFAATVTWSKGVVPDGERVTFYDRVTAIGTGTTAGGVARLTTSSLTANTHTIYAAYAGDSTFNPSRGFVTQVVDKYATTTTAPVSSLNPSTYGQSVTWTATVSSSGPNPPTGKVYFVGIGFVTLSGGVATARTAWLKAGTHAITAEYKGDGASAPSTSSVLDQVVKPASTKTAITSSANPSSQGQSVTFTVKVTSSTGAHATGTVTFTAGATTLGTVSLDGVIATISTSALPVGVTTIKATYNAVTDFTGSSASLSQRVQP